MKRPFFLSQEMNVMFALKMDGWCGIINQNSM